MVSLKDYARLGKAALGPSTPAGRAKLVRGRSSRSVRGTMNKLESRYAAHLERERHAGRVSAYYFEALKFRLADKTWYSPDFMVLRPDGMLELHECKGGFMEEDANVKLKVTSEVYWMYPVFLVKEVRGAFVLREIA